MWFLYLLHIFHPQWSSNLLSIGRFSVLVFKNGVCGKYNIAREQISGTQFVSILVVNENFHSSFHHISITRKEHINSWDGRYYFVKSSHNNERLFFLFFFLSRMSDLHKNRPLNFILPLEQSTGRHHNKRWSTIRLGRIRTCPLLTGLNVCCNHRNGLYSLNCMEYEKDQETKKINNSNRTECFTFPIPISSSIMSNGKWHHLY